jgi:hypothetical protein
VWDITRQVARRIQQEREQVESPAWPLQRVVPFTPGARSPVPTKPMDRPRLAA